MQKPIQIKKLSPIKEKTERKMQGSFSLPESVFNKFEALRKEANYPYVATFYGDILELIADLVEVYDPAEG